MKRSELPKDYVEPQKLRKEFKENRITGDNKSEFPIEYSGFSAAYLREHCRRNELYMIPKYNDVLYLHYKVVILFESIRQFAIIPKKFLTLLMQGLSEIENLEEYTDLKCLWLENNSIKTIKGLDHLSLLKCLFLHHNRIEQITVTSMNFEYHLNSPLPHRVCPS